MKWTQILAVCLVALSLASCRATTAGPYSPLAEGSRDTSAAEKLNRKAADLIDTAPADAESLLREALTRDVFYGPAHNNLGVVFMNHGKLYEAANEFEWARKLLPDSPDPRVNLALTMERAGRREEAFRGYLAALEVTPECVAAMQGAATIALRDGRAETRVESWLAKIALAGESAAWRDWARSASGRSHPE
jgi:tetratricopeptide (TPR) repeat protein